MRNKEKVFVKTLVAASIATLGICALFADDEYAKSSVNEPSANIGHVAVRGLRDALAVIGVICVLRFMKKKLQGAKGQKRDVLQRDEEPNLRRNSVSVHVDVNSAQSSMGDRCHSDDTERILCDIAELSDELLDATASAYSGYALDRIDEILQRHGAMPIAGSMKYDPRFHRAIPTGVVEKDTPIIDTIRNGWTLHGRILRRARVKVAL